MFTRYFRKHCPQRSENESDTVKSSVDIKIEQLEQLGIEANNAHFATIHDTESVITVCHTTPLPRLRKRLIQHTQHTDSERRVLPEWRILRVAGVLQRPKLGRERCATRCVVLPALRPYLPHRSLIKLPICAYRGRFALPRSALCSRKHRRPHYALQYVARLGHRHVSGDNHPRPQPVHVFQMASGLGRSG